jgi:hypothetical protein
VRLIHIDNLPRGGATTTTRMLQAGVDAYNAALPDSGGRAVSERIDLEVVTFDHFEKANKVEDVKTTVISVALPERELSHRASGTVAPCRSLMTAQNLIRQISNIRVFLIPIPSVTPMTGIDVVASLLSGVSGIVDERGLIMPEVIQEIVRYNPVSRRSKSMLLIGELNTQLQAIKDLVDDWDSDETIPSTLDLAIWKAAMALAQLERLEMLIGVGRSPSCFSTLADALNLAEPVTSFRHNIDDLRKLLPHLARILVGEDHEPGERFKLPAHARDHGFPRHQPFIAGFDYATTSRKIFHALRKLEIRRMEDVAGISRRIVRVR